MSSKNTQRFSRRSLLQSVAALGALSLSAPAVQAASLHARIVVIGGGFGGASVARALKAQEPSLDVTLVEPKTVFVTCPYSNAYLAGLVPFETISHDYSNLKIDGISVIHDRAVGLSDDGKALSLENGESLPFERLIVAPGIGFDDPMEGYQLSDMQYAPAAWNGGDQTKRLRAQLEAMKDGGVFVMVPPEGAFRCPPGPYERASMVAHYLKTNKPKSKILIADRKDKFSKQKLFEEGWAKEYPGMIEWIPEKSGGRPSTVEAAKGLVHLPGGPVQADVLNFIPNQRSGLVADALGLTDESGWCPVDLISFESLQIDNVHVIGDSAYVPGMPKSGNAAHTQAQACAMAILTLLDGGEPQPAVTSNTCFSLITPTYGISVSQVYHATENRYVKAAKNSGGTSPLGAGKAHHKREAKHARGWYDGITGQIWG